LPDLSGRRRQASYRSRACGRHPAGEPGANPQLGQNRLRRWTMSEGYMYTNMRVMHRSPPKPQFDPRGTILNEHPLIVRRSLHDEITNQLRDMIVEGDLKPGQKIPEPELCGRFGVSRTPLREALKVLAAEGIVQLLPNRGAVVAKITQEEIEQIFPIMGVLEALAGELACERITEVDLEKLRRLHKTMIGHYRRGEWLSYSKLNRAVHEAIFAAAGNASLSAIYQQLIIRIHAIRFVAKKTPERWHQAADEHEQMMEALKRRDGKQLAKIMRLHLRNKAEMVKEAMEL
jgi:DNA-binding GntR family transcriptional regulator